MLLFQYIHTFYIKISILLNIWYSLTFVVYISVQFKEHSFHMKDQGMAINANTCAHTHTHIHSYSWFANSAITLGERENRTVVHYVYVITCSSCTYCIACLHSHKALYITIYLAKIFITFLLLLEPLRSYSSYLLNLHVLHRIIFKFWCNC